MALLYHAEPHLSSFVSILKTFLNLKSKYALAIPIQITTANAYY